MCAQHRLNPHLRFETRADKTCHAQSPRGATALYHSLCQTIVISLFENNELIVHHDICLLRFGHFEADAFLGRKTQMLSYWSPTWFGCKGVEKETGHLPDDRSEEAVNTAEEPNTLRKT